MGRERTGKGSSEPAEIHGLRTATSPTLAKGVRNRYPVGPCKWPRECDISNEITGGRPGLGKPNSQTLPVREISFPHKAGYRFYRYETVEFFELAFAAAKCSAQGMFWGRRR